MVILMRGSAGLFRGVDKKVVVLYVLAGTIYIRPELYYYYSPIETEMGDTGSPQAKNGSTPTTKKQILLNAFDMSTVGHLSPGQWKVRSAPLSIP